jgi:hypothetical protein
MTKLHEIEKSVEEPGPMEFSAFAKWFEPLLRAALGPKARRDIANGKLHRLSDSTLTEFRAGKSRAPWRTTPPRLLAANTFSNLGGLQVQIGQCRSY